MARRALSSDLIRPGRGYLERVPFSPLGDAPQISAHTCQDMSHPSHDSLQGPTHITGVGQGCQWIPFPMEQHPEPRVSRSPAWLQSDGPQQWASHLGMGPWPHCSGSPHG